ncbi:MAG: hypothetical protein HGA45_41105 [Chloroflexales bacterium]|nr:hypothetical protein [Chloroflexales bacterium]
MPLLHKPSPAPADQAAPEAGELADLVARLLAQGAHSPPADHPQSARPARRRATTGYDRLVIRLATGIGLLVCALAWGVGAYCTIAWLASLGLGWAVDATRQILWLFRLTDAPAPGSFSGSTVLVWAIPLGISLAEIGFDPGRVRGLASRLLWAAFLTLDATTTGLGVALLLAPVFGSGAAAAALAASVGLLLALVPEKLARRLIRENL